MSANLTETQKSEINISAILNQYVYQDEWKESFSGKSLSWIMNHSEKVGKNAILQEALRNNPEMGNYELISQSNIDTKIPDTELIACAFKEPNSGNVYVAYRGTGDGKWVDNGDAFTKQSSLMQDRAVEYFNSVVENNHLEGEITVTGHSKGGNSAQYVTMASKYSDKIKTCYSLDGQGFSSDAIAYFKEKYGVNYEEQLNKMYSINGANDYVHDLGNAIIPEENTCFIETTAGDGIVGWHTLDGYFSDGKVNWKFTEQGPMGEFAKELSKKMMALDKEDLDDCAISIMSFLEKGEDYNIGTGDRKTATLEECIGFLATGIPLIVNTAITSDGAKQIIGGYISDFVNEMGNSEYGKLKLAAGITVLTFATPFIALKLVPLALDVWVVAYITENLHDLYEKAKEFNNKVADYIASIITTVETKLNDFGNQIKSNFSDIKSLLIDSWNGKNIVNGFFNGNSNRLIQIDSNSIRDQANNVRKYKTEQENTMNRLRKIVYSLSDSWRGDAQEAFVIKFQSMESVYKKFSSVLEQYAALMDKAANEMQATDHSIKSMIQNI